MGRRWINEFILEFSIMTRFDVAGSQCAWCCGGDMANRPFHASSLSGTQPGTPLGTQTTKLALSDGRSVELREFLGKGTNSVVYRGLLESSYGLRRTVALKLFDGIAAEDTDAAVERFASTFRQSASVRHANVVDVYDFGVHGDRPFVVSELVEGVTLRSILDHHASERRRVRLDLALFIAAEIAEALSGAFSARDPEGYRIELLHLGLSPSEVFLSFDGSVKVEGFGLAMLRLGNSSIHDLEGLARRAMTLSPELAAAEPGDARSDVFALGAVLRELFVGPRFSASTNPREALRLAREGYVQPLTFQPHLPDDLVHVLERSLEIDPSRRYPNVTAMASTLRGIAASMGATEGRSFLRQELVAFRRH